jgi:mono/diheme cytochrome c family protein
MGYPDARASTHYVPELQAKGQGPLYGHDIDDPRGNATLTPSAFAALAAVQPEFSSCMTRKLVDYVLGDRATAEDRAAVRKAFEAGHSFKSAMRVALGRYASRWMHTGAAAVPAPVQAGTTPASASDRVAIGGTLRAQLDEHCVDCHDEAEFIDSSVTYGLPFDFRGGELARELVVRMTDHLAYRKMPKDPDALDDATRASMVELLVNALWQDEAARREALMYYLDRMRPMPAHQIDVALMAIDNNAGKRSGIEWGLLERALYPDQAIMTPGFVATTALEALEACATPGQDSSRDLVLCLERVMSVSRLSRWPE